MSVAALPVPSPAELERGVAVLEGGLDAMSVAQWATTDPALVRRLCTRLSRVRARIEAHQVAAARALEACGAAKAAGASSTGALLGADFGGDRRTGDELVRTGKVLTKAKATATERALADGEISQGQAAAIAGALTRLPAETTDAQRQACEAELLGDAGSLSLTDLRRRGDRISDTFAPQEHVGRTEDEIVAARERSAWARTELRMRDNADGTFSGRFTIPEAQATLLQGMLDAQAAPRRHHLGADGRDLDQVESLTYAQRMGRAFCALIEHVPPQGYPASGGTPLTLTVSIGYDWLLKTVGCGTLDGSVRVSAGQLRRMACQQGILPMVLGGASLPLDLGRTRRLFTPGQRTAIAHRDRGCAFPGCDRKTAWCECHHAGRPWARDGQTNLDEGVLLCAFHHHLVHDQAWSIRFHPRDGIPEFAGPGSPRWRRNQRYRQRPPPGGTAQSAPAAPSARPPMRT